MGLTCQSVLSLKEGTESTFDVSQTPLILLVGLLLQIAGSQLQLLKTEKGQRKDGFVFSLIHPQVFVLSVK